MSSTTAKKPAGIGSVVVGGFIVFAVALHLFGADKPSSVPAYTTTSVSHDHDGGFYTAHVDHYTAGDLDAIARDIYAKASDSAIYVRVICDPSGVVLGGASWAGLDQHTYPIDGTTCP